MNIVDNNIEMGVCVCVCMTETESLLYIMLSQCVFAILISHVYKYVNELYTSCWFQSNTKFCSDAGSKPIQAAAAKAFSITTFISNIRATHLRRRRRGRVLITNWDE